MFRFLRINIKRFKRKFHLINLKSRQFSRRPEKMIDFHEIPIDRIRNFSIIAHVDHGKSTLADRLLELTGILIKNSGNQQVLDNLQVERERGITVKAQTCTLLYNYKDNTYLLNLIDTPGHVDFSNEVSRSLAACDGVILLVDACHGIQAQTVANYQLANDKNLVIVPALNKIDIKHSKPDQICADMKFLFNIEPTDIIRISAKFGTNIEKLLENVIEKIPPPKVNRNETFRGLLFDSWYDRFRGALNLLFINDGEIKLGDEIQSYQTKNIYQVKTLSLLRPSEVPVEKLVAGQVGLIGCNMRNSKESIIGDTLFLKTNTKSLPLERFKIQKPMIYAGIYPIDQSKYLLLKNSIEKLILNDSVVTIQIDSSPALGQGWRLGFLGLLHMEVFCQRLKQEYNTEPIITTPSVPYKIRLKSLKMIKQNYNNDILLISNAANFPEMSAISECYEPFVKATIITPVEYVGQIISLCIDRRGQQLKSINIDNERILMKYLLPLNEIILDFNDLIKSISSGYASFNYEDDDYHETNIIKLDIHLNGKIVQELARIVHVSKVNLIARNMVQRLKELIPRQMIQIAIQACCGSKILARETLKPYRKDVTAKLYGGDVTRRMKLLNQQAEGKKKMRSIGKVHVPHETFINVLKR